MAERFKFAAELAKIVNFPVVNHRQRPGLVPDWLAAARQINNAQALHTDREKWRDESSFFIRAAMDHAGHHPANSRFAGLLQLDSDGAANSAHGLPQSFRSAMGDGAIRL